MSREVVEERIRSLGITNNVAQKADILTKCKTVDEVGAEMVRTQSSCGDDQYVYLHFNPLIKQDTQFRESFLAKARMELQSFGIRPEHIDEYFQIAGHPGLVFTLRHEDKYGRKVRDPFYEKADQMALDGLRNWLGISKD